jgi:hypothetical protein
MKENGINANSASASFIRSFRIKKIAIPAISKAFKHTMFLSRRGLRRIYFCIR